MNFYRCLRCGSIHTEEEIYNVFPGEIIPYCPVCNESDFFEQVSPAAAVVDDPQGLPEPPEEAIRGL